MKGERTMFYVKTKARRKDAKRHISAKSHSPSQLFPYAKMLSEKYDVEIWYNNRVEWVYDKDGNRHYKEIEQ